MLTVTFVLVVAWSGFAVGTAAVFGRRLRRVHRAASVAAAVGVALILPTVVLGAYGFPTGMSTRSILAIARTGSVGLPVTEVAGVSWVATDTAFVWSARRRLFPFAYGDDAERSA